MTDRAELAGMRPRRIGALAGLAPATDTILYGISEIPSGGGGCGNAELTIQGIGVSAVLKIGAIASAAAAASVGRKAGAN